MALHNTFLYLTDANADVDRVSSRARENEMFLKISSYFLIEYFGLNFKIFRKFQGFALDGSYPLKIAHQTIH